MYGRTHVLKKLTAAGIMAAAASGVMLLGSPANADTRGDGGVLSGNEINVPITAPINVCGNSIAILGIAGSGCRGGATVWRHHHHHHGYGY
jgi:hypothetical protein